MEITYDSAKDLANREKHGLSLGEATRLNWDAMKVEPDMRRNYGEKRQIGYAPMDGRIYCVVFVLREGAYRIVSLRKANNRERNLYEAD